MKRGLIFFIDSIYSATPHYSSSVTADHSDTKEINISFPKILMYHPMKKLKPKWQYFFMEYKIFHSKKRILSLKKLERNINVLKLIDFSKQKIWKMIQYKYIHWFSFKKYSIDLHINYNFLLPNTEIHDFLSFCISLFDITIISSNMSFTWYVPLFVLKIKFFFYLFVKILFKVPTSHI